MRGEDGLAMMSTTASWCGGEDSICTAFPNTCLWPLMKALTMWILSPTLRCDHELCLFLSSLVYFIESTLCLGRNRSISLAGIRLDIDLAYKGLDDKNFFFFSVFI